jgi:thiosulfate/3-mercaptopyruvate sulfurtransferase
VVLKGGFPAWLASGGEVSEVPVDDSATALASVAAATGVAATYPAELDKDLVKSMDEVAEALKGDIQLVDARSSGRFRGLEPEPRPGMPSGAMPGEMQSRCCHSSRVVGAARGVATQAAALFHPVVSVFRLAGMMVT